MIRRGAGSVAVYIVFKVHFHSIGAQLQNRSEQNNVTEVSNDKQSEGVKRGCITKASKTYKFFKRHYDAFISNSATESKTSLIVDLTCTLSFYILHCSSPSSLHMMLFLYDWIQCNSFCLHFDCFYYRSEQQRCGFQAIWLVEVCKVFLLFSSNTPYICFGNQSHSFV